METADTVSKQRIRTGRRGAGGWASYPVRELSATGGPSGQECLGIFFEDPARIQKERERSQAQKEKGRSITVADLEEEHTPIRLREDEEQSMDREMEAHDAENLSDEHRAIRKQARLAVKQQRRRARKRISGERRDSDMGMWHNGSRC
jgi:hypothetical protein